MPLIHVRDDIGQRHAKPLRDPSERSKRRIAQASLNAGDIRAIKPRTVGEALLRPTFGLAKLADPPPQSAQQRFAPFCHTKGSLVELALSIYYE